MTKFYVFILLVSFGATAQGSLCSDPIVIGVLPFTTSDNTANYLDSYDPQTTSHPSCAATQFGNNYHGGNEAIYSFTPSASGTIKIEIPAAVAWTGMFVYSDCANIGVTYAACATGPSAGARTIDNFAVTAGTTYYIYISSWPSPQTVAYTLNVTNLTLGVADLAAHADIKLYPVPASDALYFESVSVFNQVTVYNANGQRLEVLIEGNLIKTDKLPSGFYVLELQTQEGKRYRKNFIKAPN